MPVEPLQQSLAESVCHPSADGDWQFSFASELPPPPQFTNSSHPDFEFHLSHLDGDADFALADLPWSPPGYRMLRILGQGGMGEIYLARDLRLNRLVALKMIRANVAGPQWRARFLSEAQAVARLQHSNIVQIYEVGQSAARPYLALEYMKDGSLADRLSRTTITPIAATGLVRCLAEAIQHAHDRNLIHRDLKPGNILLNDDVVKIADFGLAKIGDELGDIGVAGTPSYMAPEQTVPGSPERIGPWTDIYALGAVLYECLSGRPPHRAANKDALLAQVRDRAPPSLPHAIPRDLEAIVRKCLHKEPTQRYRSAQALADDLGRYLRGEPILARPVGAAKRLWKWGCRRPVVAVLATLLSLATLSLFTGGWIYQTKLQESLKQSDQHRDRAKANYEKALAAVDSLLTRVGERKLADVPAMEGVRADLLQDALRFYESLLDDSDTPEPAIRWETARAQRRVAKILAYLGRSSESLDHYRQSIRRCEGLLDEFPTNREYANGLAEVVFDYATQLAHGVHSHQTGAQLDRARGLWRQLSDSDPGSRYYRTQLAKCDHQEGWWHATNGRFTGAEPAYLRALEERRSLAAGAGNEAAQRDLAMTLHNLASLMGTTRRLADAMHYEEEAVEIFESILNRKTSDEECQGLCSAGLFNLGALNSQAGRHDAARDLHKRSLALRETLARNYPHVRNYQHSVAVSCGALAAVELSRGNRNDAIVQARRAIATLETLLHDQPNDGRSLASLLDVQSNLALALQLSQQVNEAITVYSSGLQVAERLCKQEPEDIRHAAALGTLCQNRGNIDLYNGRPRESLLWFERAIRAADSALAKESNFAAARRVRLNACGSRALAHEKLRDYRAAAADWDAVVDLAPAANRQIYRLQRLTVLARAGLFERADTESRALAAEVQGVDRIQHLAEACAAAVTRAQQVNDAANVRLFTARSRELYKRALATASLQQRLGIVWDALKNPDMRQLPPSESPDPDS